MLLAADVGGNQDAARAVLAKAPERPAAIEVGEFTTLDYDGLEPMIREFLQGAAASTARDPRRRFGVAGAVTDQVARLTNVPWLVDAAPASPKRRRLSRVHILNDLEALAYAVRCSSRRS